MLFPLSLYLLAAFFALQVSFMLQGFAKPQCSVHQAGHQFITAARHMQVFGDACDTRQAQKVAQFADIIFLGVKPQYLAPVLESLAPHITPRHTVVSIAAGWTIAQLEGALPEGSAVMRIMPNTPILIGQGASAYVMGTHASDEDRQAVHRLLQDTGVAIEVLESSIDAVVGVAGSAPAYMFQVCSSTPCMSAGPHS